MSDRTAKIESYGQAYQTLTHALTKFPTEMWQFKPSSDEWSIHEIIIHITDSEANSYARCRRLIAEPGETVMAYNEMKWAEDLQYHQQSTADALELFKWLRQQSYKLIKVLPDKVWTHTIEHPENGTMTFDDWLDTYERHVPEHVEQMERVYAAWQAQQGA